MSHNYGFKIKYLTLFLFIIVTEAAQAQRSDIPQQPALSYNFRKITQEDGLSSYNAKKIIQDSYGYIWIATQDGLNRYDGKKFVWYNKAVEAAHRLVSNDIWDLAEDTAHRRLWVLSYSGLNAIDLTTGLVVNDLPAIASPGSFPNEWLKHLQLCNGRLWIGTQNGIAVYNIATRAFDSFDPIPFHKTALGPDYNVGLLCRDEYDRVWVLIENYGLVIYSGDSRRLLRSYSLRELGLPANSDNKSPTSVSFLGPGHLALACAAGLYQVSYTRDQVTVSTYPIPGGGSLLHKKINYCALDAHQQLWFASESNLYQWDIPGRKLIEVKDANHYSPQNWLSGVYCIFVDRQKQVWLGAQKGVALCSNTPSPFLSWFQSSDYAVRIDHVYYVYPYSDSLLYACAADGFYRISILTGAIRLLRKGAFFYARRLKDGRLLVSSGNRLFVLRDPDTLVDADKVYPELRPIRNECINSLAYSGDSLAVLGSENVRGIFCWHLRQHRLDSINENTRPLSLLSNIVNGVTADRRGRLWTVSDASFSIFDPAHHSLRNYHIDDPATRQPYTFYFDCTEAGSLNWLAVYGTGLIGLDSNMYIRKIISQRDGLPNAGVYKIFNWQDSALFVTTNNGLAVIDLAGYSVTNYFRKDGLHSNSFEEACGYSDTHYLYAGGVGGFTRINPLSLRKDPYPSTVKVGNIRMLTSSGLLDTSNLSVSSFTIPSDVVQTTISISAFNYTSPERTILSYQIPELNNQWINMGTEQAVNLIGLAPGKYRLLVRAANDKGQRNETAMQLTLIFMPKWYQTSWFKGLLLVTAMGLFYAFYRYRISQIRQQQRIRQNISSDLHDDIGSILNTVKIFAHMARKEQEDNPHLNQIELSLAQATIGLRDMIWVLDDSLDTIYELLERIRQFASPITGVRQIQLDVSADPEVHHCTLSKPEKRNLLLIAKETINNSIKYAECSAIRILLSLDGHNLTLEIRDNGKGFDTTVVSRGNGLKNIRQRAVQIRYTASILSTPGNGTTIIVQRRRATQLN